MRESWRGEPARILLIVSKQDHALEIRGTGGFALVARVPVRPDRTSTQFRATVTMPTSPVRAGDLHRVILLDLSWIAATGLTRMCLHENRNNSISLKGSLRARVGS